jgi:hypothetical protein
MTSDQAVAKIVALLELARNRAASPNEAAVAAAQAQAIMERYRLEQAEVDAHRARGSIAEDSLWSGARVPAWLLRLATGIAEANFCHVLLARAPCRGSSQSRRRSIARFLIIGSSSNVAVVRYLLAFVRHEIDRLTQHACHIGLIWGRIATNNYRHGAVAGVLETIQQERLRQQARFVAEHGTGAIVCLNAEALRVQRYVHDRWPSLTKLRYGRAVGHHLALEAGYAAGKTIALRRGLDESREAPAPALPEPQRGAP